MKWREYGVADAGIAALKGWADRCPGERVVIPVGSENYVPAMEKGETSTFLSSARKQRS